MQNFKNGDILEKKFEDSAEPILSILSQSKYEFYQGCYETGPLGDLIQVSNRSPLAKAISNQIFRLAFKQVFDAFVKVGTFEAYIVVFQKIFGESVDVQFTVPDPGKLNIDIIAEDVVLSDFVTRYIEENAYLFDEIIDDEGDNIAFQTIQGFQTQYELEQMLFEMVPAGIFTEITLTLGGA
jgi:hypothetical protein